MTTPLALSARTLTGTFDPLKAGGSPPVALGSDLDLVQGLPLDDDGEDEGIDLDALLVLAPHVLALHDGRPARVPA
jgi:hypothetical protein